MAAMRPLAASLLLLLGCAAVLAQTPQPTDDIDRLIAQLTSPKYAERVAAMKALEAKGKAALPALLKAAENGDLELQRRAALVIEQIEIRLAVAPLVLGSKIRLVYKDVPILDAVKDLHEKLGFRVDVEGDRVPLHDRKMTLDTGEVTFWEGFTQFCQAAGLTERKTSAKGTGARTMAYRLRLIIGKSEPAPTTFAGPLRLKILPPGDNKAAFMLEVSPEPRMPWQGARILRLTKIMDQKGQLLPLPDPYLVPQFEGQPEDNKLLVAGTVLAAEVLPVRLPAGVKAGMTLKEIHGTLAADALAPRKLTVIKNVLAAKGKTFRINNVADALKVVNAERVGDRMQLRLRIEGPLATAVYLEMIPNSGGRILRTASFMLLDAKGQPWKVTDQQPITATDDNGDVSVVVELTFQRHGKLDDLDEPAQLVVNGTVTVPVEIPFVFRDVVLPK
jgi:hypothetical protein